MLKFSGSEYSKFYDLFKKEYVKRNDCWNEYCERNNVKIFDSDLLYFFIEKEGVIFQNPQNEFNYNSKYYCIIPEDFIEKALALNFLP